MPIAGPSPKKRTLKNERVLAAEAQTFETQWTGAIIDS